jgi:hypothetical protein
VVGLRRYGGHEVLAWISAGRGYVLAAQFQNVMVFVEGNLLKRYEELLIILASTNVLGDQILERVSKIYDC